MDRTIPKSGLIKKELLLLRPLVKEPWREFTLSEIKTLTKNKSHHYVYEALKKFAAFNLVKGKKPGNTRTYALNEENQELHYLALTEALVKEERTDLPFKVVKQITQKLKSPFYILLIGGSYAEKKQKPTSDLDVAFIIPNAELKKPYEIALREGELTVPEVHGFVFSQEEFYQMLVNKEFNLGKELARKHILVYGAEAYYQILFEAMKHGFKG